MLLTLTGICLKPWTKCRRSVSCQVGVSLFRPSLCLSAGEKEEESLAESLMVLEAVSISCRTIQNCRTLVVAGDAKGERRIGIAVATLSLVGLSPSMPETVRNANGNIDGDGGLATRHGPRRDISHHSHDNGDGSGPMGEVVASRLSGRAEGMCRCFWAVAVPSIGFLYDQR